MEVIVWMVVNSGECCLLGGFIYFFNWDVIVMENLLYSVVCWDLDLDLYIDEEFSEVF